MDMPQPSEIRFETREFDIKQQEDGGFSVCRKGGRVCLYFKTLEEVYSYIAAK